MLLLVLLSSALLYLAFPNIFNLYGYPLLSWFFAVPLFYVYDKCGNLKRLWFGLVWGLSFYSAIISWLYPYNKTGYVLFVCVLCVQSVLFALFYRANKGGILNLVFVPALWVACEYARSFILSGFSWDIGYSQAFVPFVVKAYSLPGSAGVSFMLVLVNYSLYQALFKKRRRMFLSALAFVFLFFYGAGLFFPRVKPEAYLGVCTIQPNIASEKKVDINQVPGFLKQDIRLSMECVERYKPQLIVWPETAIPSDVINDNNLRRPISSLASDADVYLLIGAAVEEKGKVYNSAVLFNPAGEVAGRYNKHYPIPFSEYLPGPGFLRNLATFLGAESCGFSPGAGTGVLSLKAKNVLKGNLHPKFGVVICSEETLGFLFLRYARGSAAFVIAMLNDGWFGQDGALMVHAQNAVVHAAENGIPVVRASNTGWSGFIDSNGNVTGLNKARLNSESIFFHKVGIYQRVTFYAKIGHIFNKLCFYFVIIFLVLTFIFRPMKGNNVI